MKYFRSLINISIICTFISSGCSNYSSWSKDDLSYVASLSQEEQVRIREKSPAPGDSLRGLILAYGRPSFKTKLEHGTEYTFRAVKNPGNPQMNRQGNVQLYDLYVIVSSDYVISVRWEWLGMRRSNGAFENSDLFDYGKHGGSGPLGRVGR